MRDQRTYRYKVHSEPVYPVLAEWIRDNCGNASELARRIGLHRTTITDLLTGKKIPTKDTIDLILKETGLTYEECFGGVRNVQQ